MLKKNFFFNFFLSILIVIFFKNITKPFPFFVVSYHTEINLFNRIPNKDFYKVVVNKVSYPDQIKKKLMI